VIRWLIEFASDRQTRTAQDKIEKLVNAVLSRISQRNEWRLSGLFALVV